MLAAAGWAVQDYKAFDPSASTGIALRELPLKSGRCDYLLLVNRKSVGVVEAKKEDFKLSIIAEQTRIVEEVERRLSVVEKLEAVVTTNLQRATRLRQSVLQQAFTGEL
jgi:type I site-specific restriction endonuclease